MARRPLPPCNVCFRPLQLQLQTWTSWLCDFGSRFDLVCIPGGKLLWKWSKMHIRFQIEILGMKIQCISFERNRAYRYSREMLNFLWIPIKIDWPWVYQDVQFVSPLSPIWSHANLKIIITLHSRFLEKVQNDNIFIRHCFNWNIWHTSTVADTLSFAAIAVNWVAYTVPYGESWT